jgi:hypothetical protein
MNDNKLSEKETWEGEHLSEVALSCLADAQDVLDPVAKVHAESCAECMLRIGAMALESHDVGAALNVARQMKVKHVATTVHRFPTLLVAAAVLIAVGAGLPAIAENVPRLVSWTFDAPRFATVITQSLVALGKGISPQISMVATFALALAGYAVARSSREKSHGATS